MTTETTIAALAHKAASKIVRTRNTFRKLVDTDYELAGAQYNEQDEVLYFGVERVYESLGRIEHRMWKDGCNDGDTLDIVCRAMDRVLDGHTHYSFDSNQYRQRRDEVVGILTEVIDELRAC